MRNESTSRNTLTGIRRARCTCVRCYYQHLHNEQYAELLTGTFPRRRCSLFSLPLPLRLLLRADVVSRCVSRVRLWELIQLRFVNERRMNEIPRLSIHPSVRTDARPARACVSLFKSSLSAKHAYAARRNDTRKIFAD